LAPVAEPVVPVHASGQSTVPEAGGANAAVPSSINANKPVSARLLTVDGQQFSLRSAGTTRIGRALDNDIVIGDASVSRHHASIEYQDGGFVLRDLGSANGTWLDGQRVSQAPLGTGGAFRLGDALFTFHA
jgi:pSer/pThr/pTyr-binding forkhead associated (FHA) protein